MQKAEANTKKPSKVEKLLRDHLVNLLKSMGIEVSTDAKEGQEVLDRANEQVSMSKRKKQALETASLTDVPEAHHTVVSSADGAKVLKNLETFAKKLENIANNPVKTFIGSLARELGATKHGSNSQYASFVTDNGVMPLFREDDIAEKEVKNVIVDSNKTNLPHTRQEAIDAVSKLQRPFINKDQNKEIKISNTAVKHSSTQDHSFVDVQCMGVIDKIIKNAVKNGELPVDKDEKGHTHKIEVYYCPVNIDGTQYSARLIVKQYENRGFVLDDFQLYDLHSRIEKADGSAVRGGKALTPASTSAISGYKVKDLIHSTQENDQKLLGLGENFEEYALFRDPDDIFISNAERAVEGIKQEKATPEQWLKMIEKVGGLKAGEDKWMGLSDWLKEKKEI